ncbi:MAG TPA: tRNA guanosine(34) transglycosylase Tgt [Acidimicrobiia bacterium]|nr:tRNA guanosine(34) transglycosylase Tgt [Acidimicrobiia bacterium]
MSAVTWSLSARDDRARTGVLTTPHGSLNTPAFMPVGTRAAVRAVDVDDLLAVGSDIVLANTYHLMLRPGADAVAALGGLHGFWGWSGPILTDSGGFQIYSLQPRIEEEGASFRSSYDGSVISLSPEEAVRIQELLGADIAMVLDVCLGLPAAREEVATAMALTLRWAERSRTVHNRSDQALFGIVQGGVDPDLRAESAARTALLDFAGFGIGGLSVGESASDRNLALEAAFAELPPDKVRYVMGLGDPEGVMAAIERGADLFDCVWPTRLARHGRVFTAKGDFNLRRAEFQRDARPLEENCPCHTCRHHHRAYVRHLLATNELSAFRLLSIHNLTYTLGLLQGIRMAIGSQTLASHLATIRDMRLAGASG